MFAAPRFGTLVTACASRLARPLAGSVLPTAALAPRLPFPAAAALSTLAPTAEFHESVDAFMRAFVVEDDKGRPAAALRLPLPGVKGVVTVTLPSNATIGDLFDKLKAVDTSLADVECSVRAATGDVVARTSQLAHVLRNPGWTLNLGEFTVSAVSSTALAIPSLGGSPPHLAGYVTLKEELLGTSGKSLTFAKFRDMVQDHALKAGVNVNDLDATLRSWSLLLHQDGVILHLDASPDAAVRDVVFLRPNSLHDDMQEALDLRGKGIADQIAMKEAELEGAQQQLKHMRDVHDIVVTRARRRVKALAYGVGVFMVVQWGTIFHFVYEKSWDVMEPICYFIGSGYSILFYMFFMRTRQDPSTGNVFQQVFRYQQRKLQAKMVPNEEWQSVEAFAEAKEATKRSIKKLMAEVADLRRRRPADT